MSPSAGAGGAGLDSTRGEYGDAERGDFFTTQLVMVWSGIPQSQSEIQEGEGEPDSSYFYTSKIVLTQRGVPGAKLGADAAGTQGNGPQLWHAAAPRKFLTDSRREQSVNVLRRTISRLMSRDTLSLQHQHCQDMAALQRRVTFLLPVQIRLF